MNTEIIPRCTCRNRWSYWFHFCKLKDEKVVFIYVYITKRNSKTRYIDCFPSKYQFNKLLNATLCTKASVQNFLTDFRINKYFFGNCNSPTF